MKRSEEKAYYKWLERVIRERKRGMPLFSKDSDPYEMDLAMLMRHIERVNPGLADKIAGNFTDTTNMEGSSRSDILSYMGRTEKGAIVKWRNERGEEVYLVNTGDSLIGNSKHIIVIGNQLNRGDLDLLKKTMYGAVLKRDIARVYAKMAREERARKAGLGKSVIDMLEERRERKLDKSATGFEKAFKELVKEQGGATNPLGLAATMIAYMDDGEKKRLSQSFSDRGIKSQGDLEQLLAKWKDEALNPARVIERSYKQTTRKREVEVRGR